MVFKNEAQLRKFLMEKCTKAVANAQKKVHKEFADNLNQFYGEYNPREYIRTNALFNSLKVTGIKRVGNQYMSSVTTEIYFDNPSWMHGWVPLQSGDFGYSYWTDNYIFDVAMTGKHPHGGYQTGTAIWTQTMRNLGGKQGIKKLLKQELQKQGL